MRLPDVRRRLLDISLPLEDPRSVQVAFGEIGADPHRLRVVAQGLIQILQEFVAQPAIPVVHEVTWIHADC